VIGGILLGIDELNTNLDKWEARVPPSGSSQVHTSSAESTIRYDQDISENETIPGKVDDSIFRYALIGLALGVQDTIQSGLRAVDKTTRSISNVTTQIASPITHSRLAEPFRQRYNELVWRGQREVNRWVEAGLTEDTRSRLIAQNALENSFDRGIDYLTTNEEIKELIETQSVSLAGEIVEEVRERAVSADNLLEGIVRMILRKPPRDSLPPPPEVVMQQARPYIRRAGRIVRKV